MRLRFGSIVCLAMALASATGVAATDAATGQIASQAKYWEQKGRFDLAREAWLKLLRVDPDNADALAGLAAAEIRSGRPEMAKQYLQGLRQMRPDHPDLNRLETALAKGMAASGASDDLARARELARQQRYDESITEYQRVFGGKPPEGPVALEYWQTLAGAEGGWAEARRGLENLVKQRPDSPDYRLALAQHLTYREETRRQGLDQLMALAEADAARQPVQPVWRQALLWMGARPQDQRYFQAYLQRYGDDTQVANKLAAARSDGGGSGVAGGAAPRVDPRGRALKQAWADFNAGRIDEAEKAFADMRRKNPRDAEALAGLGVIRLRQDRFGEARELLQEASRRSPGRASQWRSALASARFWEQVRLAEQDRDKGRLAEAEDRLRKAIAGAPSIAANEPSVRLTLADVVLAQNRPAPAEKMYRDVLASDPGNLDAARGLMSALSQSGRITEALVVYRGLTPQQQAQIGSVGSLEALAYRQQAAEAMAKNDPSAAERLLREALVADPGATWPRLDLARLYIAQDRRDEARSLVEGLPVSGPQRGEAAYIRALIASEEQNWYDGLMWLEQVPQNERSREMAGVQQRLWVRYQAERAAVLARQGRRDEALALLAGVEPYARSPELVGAMAFAYSEAGEAGRGLYVLRQEIARNPKPDADLRLAYAGLLLRLQQHAEFDGVVDQLARGPRLTPQQEATLTELRVAQRLRLADEVRQRGDIARAYDLLEPALRANPEDPRLVMALASLYDEAGEHDRAASLYRYALKLDTRNLDAYQGMVRASLANGREDEADRWLDEAMRIAPDSRKLHVLAGRVAKARGDDGRALKYFRRALELDPDAGGGHGKLRLQMLDAHLRPVSQRSADFALPRSTRSVRGALRKVAHRRDVGTDPWNANLSGQPYVQLAQSGTSAGDLPPIPPPGYKLPRFEPQPQPNALKLDVPRNFNPPPLGPESLNLRIDPVLRSRDYAHEEPEVVSTQTDEILREIADLDDRRSMWVGVGVGLRNRDGLSGLDRLDDIELPMEVSFGAFGAGRLNVRVVPVFLDAGTVNGPELPLFGTLAFADTTGLSFEQNDGGVALGAAYQLGDFIVDVGTTPIGFEVSNVVGGVGWTPRFGNWIVDLDISRRPVTDSLLSYAGTRDPVSGREWGGVTANGGRLELTYDLGKGGLYGSGGFHFYEGKNVEDNTEASLGGGAYLHVYRDAIQRVTVGFNVTSFFFDENLRRFTFGHGGYFSPERYLSLALPVEWVGGHHRYSWKIHGAIGLQNFREEGAALYPEDSGLQAAIEEFSAANPDLFIATGYGSNSHTGTGMSFGGQVEYLIAPQLVVGARASFDNAQDYDETRVLAYLRWSPGRTHAVQVPPRPVVPFADYRKKLP